MYTASAPAVTNAAPAPAVTCAHAAPVVKCMTPVSTVACAAPVTTLTAAHRQVHLIQRVQKMVEVPQIQFTDKVVGAPVSMQRQVQVQEQSDDTMADTMAAVTTRVNLNTSGAMAPHRNRTSANEMEDEGETRAPGHFSLCDGAELETRFKGEHEGATGRWTTSCWR